MTDDRRFKAAYAGNVSNGGVDSASDQGRAAK